MEEGEYIFREERKAASSSPDVVLYSLQLRITTLEKMPPTSFPNLSCLLHEIVLTLISQSC